VPEFIQDDATPENLEQALINVLADRSLKAALERKFAAMAASLRHGAAEYAARAVLPLLRE
jgi:lipid-A-disaccharide synthase